MSESGEAAMPITESGQVQDRIVRGHSPFWSPAIALVATLGIAILWALLTASGAALVMDELGWEADYVLGIFRGEAYPLANMDSSNLWLIVLTMLYALGPFHIALAGASLFGWRPTNVVFVLFSTTVIIAGLFALVSGISFLLVGLAPLPVYLCMISAARTMNGPIPGFAKRVVLSLLAFLIVFNLGMMLRLELISIFEAWIERRLALGLMVFVTLFMETAIAILAAIIGIIAFGGLARRDNHAAVKPSCASCELPTFIDKPTSLFRSAAERRPVCAHDEVLPNTARLRDIIVVVVLVLGTVGAFFLTVGSTWPEHIPAGLALAAAALLALVSGQINQVLAKGYAERREANWKMSARGIGIALPFAWIPVGAVIVTFLVMQRGPAALLFPFVEIAPFALCVLLARLIGWPVRRRYFEAIVLVIAGLLLVSYTLDVDAFLGLIRWGTPLALLFLLWDGAKAMEGASRNEARNLIIAGVVALIITVYVRAFDFGVFEATVEGILRKGVKAANIFSSELIVHTTATMLLLSSFVLGFVALGGPARLKQHRRLPNEEILSRWIFSPRALWQLAFEEDSEARRLMERETSKRAGGLFLGAWVLPLAIFLAVSASSGVGDGFMYGLIVALSAWPPLAATTLAMTDASLAQEKEDEEGKQEGAALVDSSAPEAGNFDEDATEDPLEAIDAAPAFAETPVLSAPDPDVLRARRRRNIKVLVAGGLFFAIVGVSTTALSIYATVTHIEWAERFADPCSELETGLYGPTAKEALREVCVTRECERFNQAIEAGDPERALNRAAVIVSAGGEASCDAGASLLRAAAWEEIEADTDANSAAWCISFRNYLDAVKAEPTPMDALLLSQDQSHALANGCAATFAQRIEEASRAASWMKGIEAIMHLERFKEDLADAITLSNEELERARIHGLRFVVCNTMEAIGRAETAGTVEKSLNKMLPDIMGLAPDISVSEKDVAAIVAATTRARNEQSRCDRVQRAYDRCARECRRYAWDVSECISYECRGDYVTCDRRRDGWQRRGRGRSNVAMPSLELCSSSWRME